MSAAIKVKRYQANESDFTKTGRNRTEVKVPASVGFSDLTGSKVILDMHATVMEGSTIVPLPVAFGNGEMIGGAQALLRNSRVISAQNGLLNERRYANVIDANLDWYTSSRAQEDAHASFGNSTTTSFGVDPASGLPDCPFIVYSRPSLELPVASNPAYTRRAEIPVAWKHIDNFGNMSQFPHINVGDLTYDLEFESQIDTVFPAPMPSRAPVPCYNQNAVGGKLQTLTLYPTSANLYRPPQVGDVCTAFFQESTGTIACFAPRAVPSGMGAFTCGAAAMDQIATVTLTSGLYTVTLLNGFAVAGATDLCTKIMLSYFSPAELDGNTDNKIPLPLGANIYGSSTVIGGAGGAPITFIPNSLGGIEATLHNAVAAPNNFTVTADAYKSIPWYVGAPVTLSGIDANANSGTGAPVRLETFISQIDVDVATKNVLVRLQDTITLTAGGGPTYSLAVPCLTFRDSKVTGDVFTGATAKFTCDWNVDELYLELLQLQLTPSMMQAAMKQMSNLEIPFYDQILVQKNMPSTTVHTEVLSLPANTVGMTVLTPQNLTLISGFDNCTSYRVALNGKELTNQDITVGNADQVGRQIHNVLLREHLINIGRQLKKYDAPKFCYDINVDAATHAMYGVVVPQVPVETIFQIQLFATNAMASKNIYFVHHIERVLKLGGAGKAMIV